MASRRWRDPQGPTHRLGKLVAISGDADAVRARFEGRAQLLADYNFASCSKAGLASADSGAAFDGLDAARKANARSGLGYAHKGPTGDERAPHNLEPNSTRARHAAGFQEFGHLVNDFSDWRPRPHALLRRLGLEELEERVGPVFAREQIDENALPFLTVADLVGAGVATDDAQKVVSAVTAGP